MLNTPDASPLVLAIAVASLVLAVAVAPIWLYLFTLVALSWRKRPPADDASKRLVCVVPAHNEEGGIGATVASLLASDYPGELRRILVIADNCSDATADNARAAGAEVLVRKDDVRRGKGFALEAAFEHVLKEPWAQGVIVVDADTIVAPNLWRAVSARIAAGALAMQVTNAVRNPNDGWRPRLQAIAMAMINGVRSLGRERLGTSVGLRGTGMAFARETLERVPHKVYGVVEDVEYGVRLGFENIRVQFAPETWISSDAPADAQTALSQRRRWEGGRLALMRTMLPRVVKGFFEKRTVILFDLALDLIVPPISYPALVVVLGLMLEAAHVALTGTVSIASPLWAFHFVALVAYVLRGVAFSGTGLAGLVTLAFAPAYIAWKLVVARPWKNTDRWVRTRRANESASGAGDEPPLPRDP